MSMLSRGLALLKRQLLASNGVEVVYARGATTQTLAAVVGRTLFALGPLAGSGAAVVYGDRDYLIHVDDFAITGPATPKDGDRITEVIDGVSLVFEVKPPVTGEPSWRYSDPSRTRFRLHCKRVS